MSHAGCFSHDPLQEICHAHHVVPALLLAVVGTDTLGRGDGADQFEFRRGHGPDGFEDFAAANGDTVMLGAGMQTVNSLGGNVVLTFAAAGATGPVRWPGYWLGAFAKATAGLAAGQNAVFSPLQPC